MEKEKREEEEGVRTMDEDEKKRKAFEDMFGDSDSDDDDDQDQDFGEASDLEERDEENEDSTKDNKTVGGETETVKGKLAKLAKQVKKGKKKKTQEAGDKSYLSKRQRDAALEKEKQRKEKAKKSADEAAMWDIMDSENDEEGEADETDKKFIDDDGAADIFDSSGDEGDDVVADAPQAEEAEEEEEDEVERRLQKRKARGRKRKELDPAEKQHICRSILSRMEAAYDADAEALKRDELSYHKLKLLGEVESVFSLKHMHETLLYEGCLNVLKSWLAPLPNWTLPVVKIRGAILRILKLMNIRAVDDKLDKLKSSGIGKVVMFLYKCSDETPDNKRICGEIIQAWSRPIFAQNDSYTQQRIGEDINENRLVRERPSKKLKRKKEVEDVNAPIHRQRLRVPEPSRMDFKVQPASRVNFDKVKKEQSSEKSADKRYREKFAKKNKPNFSNSTKMSVEGRGM